jgi:ABC-type dipeptide/oligopeptide/nickel transport system permease subunit
MTEKTRKYKILSLQPDLENMPDWGSLTEDDFAPASAREKAAFLPARESESYRKNVWHRLRRNHAAMAALGVLLFAILFAFAGPLLVPYGYDEFNADARNLPPYHYSLEDQRRLQTAQARSTRNPDGVSGEISEIAKTPGAHPLPFGYSSKELQRIADGERVFPHVFGTDLYGRDILVRVMYGTRVSMTVGVGASLLALLIGAVYGAISGYFGGKVDAVMQRIVELVYSVPETLVALVIATALKPALTEFVRSGSGPLHRLVGALGPNLIALFIAFGLLYWVTMSRIIRGQILQLKHQAYITAARALGASGGRIIKTHLLPNCMGQIVVTTFLQIPSAIFLESFLSYLGVGVSAPLPSLGSMANDALSGMYTYPYRLIIPSVVLSVIILAFNLFGDGLRDALDPKLKK